MQHSLTLIRLELKDRLVDDYFSDLHELNGPRSVRQYIEFMAGGNVALREAGESGLAKFPDLTDLNITFEAFLNSVVILRDGHSTSIRYLFEKDFCGRLVRPLLAQVVNDRRSGPPDEVAFNEMKVGSWREWGAAMSSDDSIAASAGALFQEFSDTHKDRTLLSFFIRTPVAGKFLSWGPEASSGEGRKLPTRTIEGEGYSVEVTVSRYQEVDGPVTAYEWLATLTSSGATEPDAAACGMVYVFDRVDGAPSGDLSDLVLAADSMADSDVLQARAFIDQHQDADELISTSDLCFVWLWERRTGAAKGLGAKCLVAGLTDLRRRFKKVRTAIFDVRPSQFVDWSPQIEPPMVTIEKQTAVENIVQYIGGLPLNFEVRPVFNRSRHPFHDAMLAVGAASYSKFGQDDDDDNDDDNDVDQGDAPGIDIDNYVDQLVELFEQAGLTQLAIDLEMGEESYLEVEAALRHLVFDPFIFYIRLPAIEGSNEMRVMERIELSLEEAMEEVEGFPEFFETLPDDIEVRTTFYVGDLFVCQVVASTPFGALVDYFTLVPKPRPLNIQRFFQSLDEM